MVAFVSFLPYRKAIPQGSTTTIKVGTRSLMDAVERAVHTLHVLSSALGRIGSRFFLCVTVRFSERIAARSLFTEYGEYVGAGALTAAYIAERAETFGLSIRCVTV